MKKQKINLKMFLLATFLWAAGHCATAQNANKVFQTKSGIQIPSLKEALQKQQIVNSEKQLDKKPLAENLKAQVKPASNSVKSKSQLLKQQSTTETVYKKINFRNDKIAEYA